MYSKLCLNNSICWKKISHMNIMKIEYKYAKKKICKILICHLRDQEFCTHYIALIH